MEINALVISGLDPGAIPGGSTNLFPRYRRHFLNANDNFAQEYALAA
jgi:hypothetical protein